MIDILVSHYNEPVEMVSRFLDMLDGQDADGFSVIVGNDGHDVPIPREVMDRDYEVRYVETYHGGVSHIRNVLLNEATSDYVAFCDCDDRYLHGGLGRLIALCDGHDVVRTPFVAVLGDGTTRVLQPDVPLFHGKAFRREHVLRNALFDEDLIVSCDHHFIMQATLNASVLDSPDPLYEWGYRDDSVLRGTERFRSVNHWYHVESYGRLAEMYADDRALHGLFLCRLVHGSYRRMHSAEWGDDFPCRFAERCLRWWLRRYVGDYLSIPEDGRRYRFMGMGSDLPFEEVEEWAREMSS